MTVINNNWQVFRSFEAVSTIFRVYFFFLDFDVEINIVLPSQNYLKFKKFMHAHTCTENRLDSQCYRFSVVVVVLFCFLFFL